MSATKVFTIFFALIAFGLSSFYLVRLGTYPVAVVGASIVSARSLNATVIAAHRYYVQSLQASGDRSADDAFEDHAAALELRRAALDRLIEDAIISRELKDRLGEDLESVIADKLAAVELSPKTEKAVSTLYGLTLARFREMVLAPKAREEILQGRVFAEGNQDFGTWLKNIKKNVKIVVLAPDLAWNGEKVVVK